MAKLWVYSWESIELVLYVLLIKLNRKRNLLKDNFDQVNTKNDES